MSNRQIAIEDFLASSQWHDATRSNIAGDASNRRYDRLQQANGHSAILMDAPPEKGEDVRPFIQIAQHLTQIGLSAPTIHEKDEQRGLLVLEDLGDDLYARVLSKSPQLEMHLYEAAIDALTHLHQTPCPDLPAYDTTLMTNMALLAYEWYLFEGKAPQDSKKIDAFSRLFKPLLETLESAPKVLIQRDYHAENLLWMPQRIGVKKVGLLDFQDAMAGHQAYDLVSVLQDARRDVSLAVQDAMKARFIQQNALDEDAFEEAYAILGLQRNLRILGVFSRLCLRDGKAHYVDLMPRVWGHIQSNLMHPKLQEIAQLLENDLPVPTNDTLKELKSKCATIPHQ